MSNMEQNSEELLPMCKQAYYDILLEHISQTPPNYSLLIELFGEIKYKLTHILKNGSALRLEIEERLDDKYFEQMIQHDAFSQNEFAELVEYTFTKCMQLGSAARDYDTNMKKNRIFEYMNEENASFAYGVVLYVKSINECLDLMYEDLHNYLNEIEN